MSAVKQSTFVTVEEYLEMERNSQEKHEYVNGVVYRRGFPPGHETTGMAGGKPAHNNIAVSTLVSIQRQLEGRNTGCEANGSDTAVRVLDGGRFYYPDISIVCGDAIFDDSYCLRNPLLIIEVLSDSTADYDRGEKFRSYRRIPSLRHYLLIDQERVYVEHHERLDSGIWGLVGEYVRRDEVLAIPDMGIAVPLAEIYRRVLEAPDTDVPDAVDAQ